MTRTTVLLSSLLLALGAASAAAQPSQEELTQRRDKKLAEKFLQNGDWHTDYEAALADAVKTGRMVFGYFSRSYSP
jgi:hypothetical protein